MHIHYNQDITKSFCYITRILSKYNLIVKLIHRSQIIHTNSFYLCHNFIGAYLTQFQSDTNRRIKALLSKDDDLKGNFRILSRKYKNCIYEKRNEL